MDTRLTWRQFRIKYCQRKTEWLLRYTYGKPRRFFRHSNDSEVRCLVAPGSWRFRFHFGDRKKFSQLKMVHKNLTPEIPLTRIRCHLVDCPVDPPVHIDRIRNTQLVRIAEKLLTALIAMDAITKWRWANIRWSHTGRFDWMSSIYSPVFLAANRTSTIVCKRQDCHCVTCKHYLLKRKKRSRHYFLRCIRFFCSIGIVKLSHSRYRNEIEVMRLWVVVSDSAHCTAASQTAQCTTACAMQHCVI